MTPEERSAALAQARFKVRDLRQDIKHFAAAVSEATDIYLAQSADWETRYVHEGLVDLKVFADAHKAQPE